jgi:hypothetical protein
MTWNIFYLTCFSIGLTMSLLSVFGGFAHLHIGHFRFGHVHTAHAHTGAHAGHGISPLNGLTLMAFLCWFGGAGYLLHNFSLLVAPLVLVFSVLSGVIGAAVIWFALVKVLLPQERALTPADTEMTGVVARVSGSIHDGGIGEILFSQEGARRSAAARSDDGSAIEHGAEVVVMRYERGIAYVRRWDDLTGGSSMR